MRIMATSHRNIVLLSLALALAMSAVSLVITSAAVTGRMLAADPALATLPITLMFVALMASTVPASLLMARLGRKRAFLVGIAIGTIGGALAARAVWSGSFALFCLGMAGVGSANAFAQHYRFAAAEVASLEFRSTAISLVLAGGVLAALVGPNLANWSKDLLAPVTFAGSFASIVALQAVAFLLVGGMDLPRPTAAESAPGGRPLRTIIAQPDFIAAATAGVIGYSVMTLVMTATPLAVLGCGYEFADAAFVIEWHILGMYVPSFFTGRLIKRFGVLRVMTTGAFLYLGTIALNVSGQGLHGNFLPALVLLGVGWNFLFIGGTTLLTDTYSPAEKAKTQAMNDFLVFGAVAAASLSSGALYERLGWEAVNWAVLPLIGVVAASLAWLAWRRRTV